MNGLPATAVLGVSAASFSLATGATGAIGGAAAGGSATGATGGAAGSGCGSGFVGPGVDEHADTAIRKHRARMRRTVAPADRKHQPAADQPIRVTFGAAG